MPTNPRRTIVDLAPITVREGDPVDAAYVVCTSQLTLAAQRLDDARSQSAILVSFIERLVLDLRDWQESVRCLDDDYLVKRTGKLLAAALAEFPADGEHADRSPVRAQLYDAQAALSAWRDQQYTDLGYCPRCKHPVHQHDDFGHCVVPGCRTDNCGYHANPIPGGSGPGALGTSAAPESLP